VTTLDELRRQQLQQRPPALPATAADWDKLRDIKQKLTLNDRVEALHRILEEKEDYQKLLYAVYDIQAVEGSLTDDDHSAARMIRDLAKERGDVEVATQKIAAIKSSLRVVLRRYHQSRKERKNMIGGEIIADDNNGE